MTSATIKESEGAFVAVAVATDTGTVLLLFLLYNVFSIAFGMRVFCNICDSEALLFLFL